MTQYHVAIDPMTLTECLFRCHGKARLGFRDMKSMPQSHILDYEIE